MGPNGPHPLALAECARSESSVHVEPPCLIPSPSRCNQHEQRALLVPSRQFELLLSQLPARFSKLDPALLHLSLSSSFSKVVLIQAIRSGAASASISFVSYDCVRSQIHTTASTTPRYPHQYSPYTAVFTTTPPQLPHLSRPVSSRPVSATTKSLARERPARVEPSSFVAAKPDVQHRATKKSRAATRHH